MALPAASSWSLSLGENSSLFLGVFSLGRDLPGHSSAFHAHRWLGHFPLFPGKFILSGITIFPYIRCRTSVVIVRVCYLFIDFKSLIMMWLGIDILNFLWFLPSDKFREFCPLHLLIFFCFFPFQNNRIIWMPTPITKPRTVRPLVFLSLWGQAA